MPTLSHGAEAYKLRMLHLSHNSGGGIASSSSDYDLQKPSTVFLYAAAATAADVTLTRELFNNIKNKTANNDSYKVVGATVSTLNDPGRPDRVYVALHPVNPPIDFHIIGYTLGFRENTTQVDGGYNVIFPIVNKPTQTLVELARETVDAVGKVSIYNSEVQGIGCFGTLPPKTYDEINVFQPASREFFERHIRPVLLLRHGLLTGCFYAPLTQTGARTGRLPRRLPIERGYLDVDDLDKPLLTLGTIEGEFSILTSTDNSTLNETNPTVAVFPSPDKRPESNQVYEGLTSLMSLCF